MLLADGVSETALRDGMYADTISTPDDWSDIVLFCQEMGQEGLAVEILASITLNDVLRSASENTKQAVATAEQEGRQLPAHLSQEQKAAPVPKIKIDVPSKVSKTRFVGFEDEVDLTTLDVDAAVKKSAADSTDEPTQ